MPVGRRVEGTRVDSHAITHAVAIPPWRARRTRMLARSEQLPGAGDALQCACPAILENKPGARRQITNGARDQDLAGGSLLANAGADDRGDSAGLPSDDLALPGMHAGANLQHEPADAVTDRHRERTARPGASNVAKNPSPAVSTSTPW